jgi:hypothetical protein
MTFTFNKIIKVVTDKLKESILLEEELNYRNSKRNELVLRLQIKLGKTKGQVLELFEYYNSLPK